MLIIREEQRNLIIEELRRALPQRIADALWKRYNGHKRLTYKDDAHTIARQAVNFAEEFSLNSEFGIYSLSIALLHWGNDNDKLMQISAHINANRQHSEQTIIYTLMEANIIPTHDDVCKQLTNVNN